MNTTNTRDNCGGLHLKVQTSLLECTAHCPFGSKQTTSTEHYSCVVLTPVPANIKTHPHLGSSLPAAFDKLRIYGLGYKTWWLTVANGCVRLYRGVLNLLCFVCKWIMGKMIFLCQLVLSGPSDKHMQWQHTLTATHIIPASLFLLLINPHMHLQWEWKGAIFIGRAAAF